ncbi:MAG: hypothetical protein ACYC9X_04235 [Dehalococcoidia bacterium]
MGLLKKKPADEPAAEAVAEAAPGAPAADPAPPPEAAPVAAPAADAPALEAEAEGDAGAEPAPDGADALLNMFQTTQVEGDDREVLIKMAGDVELTDLVDEIGTVAAALNIVVTTTA